MNGFGLPEDLVDGIGATAHMEFLIDVADVGADGFDAELELVGDFLVEMALSKEMEDLLFARRELLSKPLGGAAVLGLEGFDHETGYLGGHGGSAMMEIGDGFEQFRRGCLFEQIARGAGSQGLEDPIMILKDGEHHDLSRG